MNTSLLDLAFEASRQCETLKHPDVEAFRVAFDLVLEAYNGQTTRADRIEDVSVSEGPSGYISVSTSWNCRGCSDADTFYLPLDIATADDPVSAATQHRLTTEVENLRRRRERALADVVSITNQLAVAEHNLATFTQAKEDDHA